MSSGSGAQIALLRTNSLYSDYATSVTSWAWTNFVSESIEHNLEELEEGSITGYKDAPPSHQGIDFGQGDVDMEPNPIAIGKWMQACFGQSSGSVLTEAGSTGANSNTNIAGKPVIQHMFIPIQSASNEKNFLPSYDVAVYKDVGSAFIFQGAQIHEMEIGVTAGQLATARFSLMSRKVTRKARNATAISSLVSSGGRPWVWDMASVQIGLSANSLAANTNFEGITINMSTPLEGVVLLDGNKNYAEFQVNEFRRVNVNGTISFRNQEEYDAFVAYENRYLRLTLTNQNSSQQLGNPDSAYYFQLRFDIPMFKFLSWSTPVGGPNRLQTQFTGRAEFDTSSLYQIEARLINTHSVY